MTSEGEQKGFLFVRTARSICVGYSGVAYSSAKGLDLSWCQAAELGLPQPDVVIFLETSPEASCYVYGRYGRTPECSLAI